MLNRIQFSGLGATYGDTAKYTLPYNPVAVNWPQEYLITNIPTIDSETAIQEAYWDSRRVTMTWDSYDPTIAGFSAMVAVLRSYKGVRKYINLQDISTLFPAEGNTWIGPFRILNVDIKIKTGGGKRWDSVELTMQRAKV